jgi:hypothetical protein
MSRRRDVSAALAILGSALLAGSAWAGSLADTNLVNLLRDSNEIVTGQVSSMTDGIDEQGLPYTEITMEVAETIRGDVSGTYTFRQFGLMQPRLSADGTKMMMPAPEIFPKFKEGEEVVLFFYPTAAWTGFRTTTGLGQGKFELGPGRVENEMGNQGVFTNVTLQDGLATENINRMLETEIGAVNPETFLSFVRRAVEQRWIETGKMYRTDEGPPHAWSPKRKPGKVGLKVPGTVIDPTRTGDSQASAN